LVINWKIRLAGFVLLIGSFSAYAFAQEPNPPSSVPPPLVYVFFQRDPSHIRNGNAESFRAVADAVQQQLKAGHVSVAENEPGGTYSEGGMPLDTVRELARKAHAGFLLYVVVERPLTLWLKVVLHLYDIDGHELWTQEAGKKAYSKSTGNRETIDRVRVLIQERAGGPGLPLLPDPGKAPDSVSPTADEGSHQNKAGSASSQN
jgi:hypothetical protein